MVAFIDSLGMRVQDSTMKAFIVFFGFEFCNEMMEIHFIRKFNIKLEIRWLVEWLLLLPSYS
jgi:hypothetical protein